MILPTGYKPGVERKAAKYADQMKENNYFLEGMGVCFEVSTFSRGHLTHRLRPPTDSEFSALN